MEKYQEFEVIKKHQQEQMLKLVTKNFYNELKKFGINTSDVVTVTVQLLDYVMQKNGQFDNKNSYYNKNLKIDKISNFWDSSKQLVYEDVAISPLKSNLISHIANWLNDPIIKYSFVSPFPEEEKDLLDYFNHPARRYFAIYFLNRVVGLIGAENIDDKSSKLEMRKFIGDTKLHGKGIGKKATFLFLYYVFDIINYNKVFIYSGDTNIKNINLNSKFGFDLEGIFFEDIQSEENKIDIIRMGLLRSKWIRIFSEFE